MKTNRFFALAMMAATVLACQKENAVETNNAEVFTAVIEQSEPDSKAFLTDELKVRFAKNDKIRVCEETFTTKKDCKCITDGTSVAEFQFNTALPANAASYYAVYPYNATRPTGTSYGQVQNLSKGDATFNGDQKYEFKAESNIFPTQVAVVGGVDPNSFGMAGKAGSDKVLRFSQMSSLVKFELKKAGVAKVVLASLNTGTYIAGRYNVQCLDTDNDGWFDAFTQGTSNNDQSSTITLLPPGEGSEFPQGVYYIATRPGRNCSGGLSLTFYDAAGNELKSFSNTSKVQLNRGKVRNLGSFTW